MFFWIVERKIHKKKDHTTGYITYCVVFLFTPLEDVVQKLSLFSIIPNSNPLIPEPFFARRDGQGRRANSARKRADVEKCI